VAKDIDIRHFSSLSKAISYIGSEEVNLVIPEPYTVNEDVTVPENIWLKFLRGGKLVIGSGYTVTINGGIEAGLWQIFDGDGSVTGNPQINVVYPEWFGAVGDGVTDDYKALQNAIDFAKQAKAIVDLGSKIYCTSKQLDLENATGVKLIGKGGGFYSDADPYLTAATIIKWIGATDSNSAVIYLHSTQDAQEKMNSSGVIGVLIDCAKKAGYGLRITSVNSSWFEDIAILDSTVHGLYTDCLDNRLNNGTGSPADNQNNYFNNIAVKTDTGDCIFLSGNQGAASTVGASTSLNYFGQIHLNIRDNDGFVFEYADGNTLMFLRVYRPAGNTGRGLVFKADDTGNNRHARNNLCYHVQTGNAGIVAEAGDGTQPSQDNVILGFSLGNGGSSNFPIVEEGATLFFISPVMIRHFGLGPFVVVTGTGDADILSKIRNQKASMGAESIRVFNGSGKHLSLVNSVAEWVVRVDSGGGFAIYPVSGGTKVSIGAPLHFYGQTVATSATAGTATGLPSAPAGYLVIEINGVTRKIPFYDE